MARQPFLALADEPCMESNNKLPDLDVKVDAFLSFDIMVGTARIIIL